MKAISHKTNLLNILRARGVFKPVRLNGRSGRCLARARFDSL